MKDTRLILTLQATGHNMEYLHHIYVKALLDTQHRYVFAVPESMKNKKGCLEWKEVDHISFHYFTPKAGKVGLVKKAWLNCCLLRTLVRHFQVNEVILIMLIDYMPFLPFFIPKGVTVSGIIYKIYLYTWKKASWIRKLKDGFIFWCYSKSESIRRVFVLNDRSATDYLNKYWKTDKFCYLTDPFMPLSQDAVRDLREELCVAPGKVVVAHVGSMLKRKGTLVLLDMIALTSPEELKKYCFIFAGKVTDEIKDEFYRRLGVLSKKVQIIVKDDFITYDYLGSVIKTADKVVLPYLRTDSSSGIIAYCAQMGTPVYVTNGGLLAKLVRRYHIGMGIDHFTDMSSVSADSQYLNSYCMAHHVSSFQQIILSS